MYISLGIHEHSIHPSVASCFEYDEAFFLFWRILKWRGSYIDWFLYMNVSNQESLVSFGKPLESVKDSARMSVSVVCWWLYVYISSVLLSSGNHHFSCPPLCTLHGVDLINWSLSSSFPSRFPSSSHDFHLSSSQSPGWPSFGFVVVRGGGRGFPFLSFCRRPIPFYR